jgi:preprotein translocase SecE subunit
MSYKKDQGRYARLFAFWSLLLLMAYGCLGGFKYFLRGMFGKYAPSLAEPWASSVPLVDKFDLAFVIALGALGLSAYVIHRVLERPKVADTLIETELELRKVTWPTANETWNGSLAVVVTVVVLLVFLTFADIALGFLLTRAMGAGI